MEFGDLGIVGYALLSCRNVREANQPWMGYHNTLIGLLVNWGPLKLPPLGLSPTAQSCLIEFTRRNVSKL